MWKSREISYDNKSDKIRIQCKRTLTQGYANFSHKGPHRKEFWSQGPQPHGLYEQKKKSSRPHMFYISLNITKEQKLRSSACFTVRVHIFVSARVPHEMVSHAIVCPALPWPDEDWVDAQLNIFVMHLCSDDGAQGVSGKRKE